MDKRILEIGEKLKKIRIEKGYSSHEFFAWENNLPRVQYWRMEKGNNFTITSLLRILDAHKMSLSEFFNDFEIESIDKNGK
jgi:predicted transcriptional regulator